MGNGRRAAVAVLALLLGLLLPQPAHAAGTTTARVASYSSDALPAARPAPRSHLDAVSAPDALAAENPCASLAHGDTDHAATDQAAPGRTVPGPRARGPPRG